MAARRPGWLRRHKVLTVIAVILLIVIVSLAHGSKAPPDPTIRPAIATQAAPSPTPSRHHRHHHRARVVTPPSPPPSPAPVAATPACSPLSDEGTCYEPGEFCRDSDHGTTGVAGDGETITCEDSDGWRWEPS